MRHCVFEQIENENESVYGLFYILLLLINFLLSIGFINSLSDVIMTLTFVFYSSDEHSDAYISYVFYMTL